ncbi:ATP-binding protein [Streptomyces hiroshimensis]|uniref:ATP-binding protein n=1 Tax=Streptomyces hiroshimensis TaxID=66424 RepID=A0ABQ2Z6G4_9ACTN|nr:ATP-binding protein [Streptomyces hiroshimensis]GGY05036.1 ATP-binding protein [Streptomyces hiroshimensis]
MLLPAPKGVAIPSIEPFEYCLRVPNDARAVPVARTTLRAALSAHGLGELAGRAELLAGEMLTNAIVHTAGDAELRMRWSEWEVLRMTVWDTCAEPPCPRAGHPYADNGRGLKLLQTLADRWNYFSSPRGLSGDEAKAVWCELTRAAPA